MLLADYYVLTELNGIEPKCQCGLCNERPNFYRGKFKKFAFGHNKYDWQEQKYIELYGQPKCQNSKCKNNVDFHRGKPNKYCSIKCEPNHWNQNKVKETIKEKYNVDEELIRSTTTEYGRELVDENGNLKNNRKVGIRLIKLAIKENEANKPELVKILNKIKPYFSLSKSTDVGDNRNSVVHGYMHPRYWDKESFEQLIFDIAELSKYSGF